MVVAVVMVAGHGTRLENDIRGDSSGRYDALVGVPKALLPSGSLGKRVLDCWWDEIVSGYRFREVYLVSNADKYKHYERWATARGFPRQNIINDGTTSTVGQLGAVADLDLVLRSRGVDEDVFVIAGDMLFLPDTFELASVVRYFFKKCGDLTVYYEMGPAEDTRTRGIVDVDPDTNRILSFHEKPAEGATQSRLASVVLYGLRRSTLPRVREFLAATSRAEERTFGHFMAWLVGVEKEVYGMKLPTKFKLIGPVGLDDYERCIGEFRDYESRRRSARYEWSHVCRTYARVGIMGNPSDGFNGKTISMTIENFWAEVSIVESQQLVIQPHPLNDPTVFGSLADLHGISRKEGYQGGLRLMQATCKRFYEYCTARGIAYAKRNFTLKYDTNIPRQVGLAGSSAIVTAALKCLMAFYELTEKDIPRAEQPNFVLSVEMEELGITAGLQDRVVQTYEGLVFMDFSADLLQRDGHGRYERLKPLALVSQFWLAYLSDPKDSGKVHSNVKVRWLNGDADVQAAMQRFAQLAVDAREAIERGERKRLCSLMDANFGLRREVYGDAVIGAENLRMVDIAHRHGSAAKFPGSGGAVLGLMPDDDEQAFLAMKHEFEASGFVFVKLLPHWPADAAP